mgnify:CR=1 FL=1
MSYQLNWVPSPNFTPGNQTQAAYGRPRSIDGGAGHWWNTPELAGSHDGIVSYMANPARQAAPHAVLSAGRVTEMVRPWDTAWCTSNANPYTYAIEIDPRIMYRWGYGNPSQAQRDLGNQIFETLCEYIADKGYHNLPWKPHNVWAPGTACNPLNYGEIMARAKQIWNDKNAPKPKEWEANLKTINPVTLYAIDDSTPLRNLANVTQVIKNFNAGTPFEIFAETRVNGYRYLLTRYAYENKTGQGFDEYELKPADPPKPEWVRNLKDIEPVKLMVLPAAGTNIVNLNDLSVISPLGKGTYVDFTKSTTVGGKEYLISKYSADRAMPNGILRADVGVPAEPPVNEKPSWLDKWEDIENKKMYTRVDAPLVNLLDGTTIKTIPLGTEIEVGSTTEWLDAKYAISEYSTGRKEPRGILLVHLDDKPIKEPEQPVEPDPEQPPVKPIDQNAIIAFLEMLGKLISDFISKLKGGK